MPDNPPGAPWGWEPYKQATPNELAMKRALALRLAQPQETKFPNWGTGLRDAVGDIAGALMLKKAAGQEQATADSAADAQVLPPPGAPPGWGASGGAGGSAAGSATSAPVPEHYAKLFDDTEKEFGLPSGYLGPTARIESGYNPENHNQLSGADGLFQFIPGTAKQYGLKYGRGPGSTGDPVASTRAAAAYGRDNMRVFMQAYGRPPTAHELYLMHQQGTQGGLALLNPHTQNIQAGALVHPRNVAANGGDPNAPAGAFIQKWAREFPQQPPAQTVDTPQGPLANVGQRVASNDPNAAFAGAAIPEVGKMAASSPQQMVADALGGSAVASRGGAGGAPAAPAGVGGGRGALPPPGTGGVTGPGVAPSLFQQRQHISPQQMHAIQRNLMIPQEIKDYYLSIYQSQFQPVEGVDKYNNRVIMGPDGAQQTITPPQTYPFKGEGGVDFPFQGLPPTPANPSVTPIPFNNGAAGPRSEAPPAAAPANVGALEPKVKTAALETGTMNDAGPLGGPPPAAPEGTKLAGPPPSGVTGPSFMPQQAQDWFNYTQDMAVQKQRREEDNRKQLELKYEGPKTSVHENEAVLAKDNSDLFKTTLDRGATANAQLKDIPLAEQALKQGAYTGFGAPAVLEFKRALAALTGSPNEAAASEVFQKLVQGLNIESLRSEFGGLGQIRLAEINMLNQANANMGNSISANQALLIYRKAASGRLAEAAKQVGEWTTENGGTPPRDLRQKLLQFYADKPIMTDEEANKWLSKINKEVKDSGEGEGTKAALPGVKATTGPLTATPPSSIPPGWTVK
jgi:hypothetical protein